MLYERLTCSIQDLALRMAWVLRPLAKEAACGTCRILGPMLINDCNHLYCSMLLAESPIHERKKTKDDSANSSKKIPLLNNEILPSHSHMTRTWLHIPITIISSTPSFTNALHVNHSLSIRFQFRFPQLQPIVRSYVACLSFLRALGRETELNKAHDIIDEVFGRVVLAS